MWKGKAAGKDTELVGYGKGTGEGGRGETLKKRAAANGRAGENDHWIADRVLRLMSSGNGKREAGKRETRKQEFSRRSTVISQPKRKRKGKRKRSKAKICIINK